MRIMAVASFGVLLAQAGLAAAPGGVGDPQIKTDHPHYKGELSCSTYERVRDTSYAHFASLPGGKTPTTETEKLVALWAWRTLNHQHADGDNIFIGIGPKHAGATGYMFCRDGLVGLFSHSIGLCYSIHSQFTPFVQLMLNDYRKASTSLVPGHTSFEAYTDGKWRWADITCGSMSFQNRTSFDALGIADFFGKTTDWLWHTDREGPLDLRLNPFGDGFSGSFNAEDGKAKFMGYLGMPIVYVLKSGESFTRWSTPAGDDGVEAIWAMDYKSWYNSPDTTYHGMARRETFLRYGPVGQNNRGRYGSSTTGMPFVPSAKGAFVYSPSFSSATAYKQGVWSETNATTSGGWLHGNGGAGEVVFQHGSPYQIAAHKASGGSERWYVETDTCNQTAIFSGTATGSVPVSVSLDNGATWTSIGTASGSFSLDFSQQVKGRFSYLLKLSLGATAGLNSMSLRTVVQVGPAVFPMLKSNGSQVTFEPGGTGVVYGGPELAKAQTFRDASKDSGAKTAFRIDAPGPIRSLHGVASSSGGNRGPISVETSIDGTNWDVVMPSVTLEPGANRNLNSSVWGNGYNSFMWGYKRYPSATSTTGWIRFENMDTGTTGQAEVYATYAVPATENVRATFNWTDGAGTHTAHNDFLGASGSQTWNVSTGSNTVTNWVKFEAIPAGPPPPTHTITASAGANGLISPSGAVVVNEGSNQTFTIAANTGYEIADVLVDSISVGALASYTFTNVTANHTISATFSEISGVEVTDIFQQGTASYSGCNDTYLGFDNHSRYGASEEIRVYNEGDATRARTLIKFDLTSIPAGSVAMEAKLHLWSWNCNYVGTVNAYQITSAWSEDATTGANWYVATGSTNWTTAGGDYSATVVGSLSQTHKQFENAWNTIVLSPSLVQGWLDNPSTNHGVILLSPSGIINRYRSSEYATVGERPRFEIKYLDTSGSCSISGTVSGAVAGGVTITLGGAATRTTTTAGDGTYTFAGLADGTYTITPLLAGYTFSPVSRTGVVVSGSDVPGQNFTSATIPTYSISGTVLGAVAAGVTVTLSGAASDTTTTNGSGVYTFTGLYNGSYIVTPSMTGYTFTPTSLNVTVSNANQPGQNFTSAAVPTFTITASAGTGGTITPNGAVIVNQGSNQTFTITPSAGYVTLDVLVNGSSVGPVASYTFTSVTANQNISASFVEGSGGLESRGCGSCSPGTGLPGGEWLLAGALLGLILGRRRAVWAKA